MDIVNINDHRKIWRTNAAGCAACGHQWQAVYPEGAQDVGLECPSCGSGLGSVLPEWAMFDTETSRVGKLLADQAEEIVKLKKQNAELVEALRRVIAVADRDTEDFRFAKATIAKATGGE